MSNRALGGTAFVVRLVIIGFVISVIAGCSGVDGNGAGAGLSTAGSPYPSLPSPTDQPASWPPPNQVPIGGIPTNTINSMGMAYTPPNGNRQPAVSREQAEQIALGDPSPYASTGQRPAVRQAYLVEQVDESAPDNPALVWVVDLSPDKPFPPVSGGNVSGGTAAPASPSAHDRNTEHWVWVTVNANSSASNVWFA
jgi:hypothetical protein